MQVPINYLAVLVAAIATYVIASIWYGVIFRKQWMQLTGVTDMKPKPLSMILPFLGSLMMSYVLDHSIIFGNTYMKTSGMGWGMQGGFFNWLGFIVPLTLMAVVYEKRAWKLWVLDIGFWFVSLLAMGAILGAWV
jgi:hypothetical protein